MAACTGGKSALIETWQAAFLGALDEEHPTKQVKALVKQGALDDWLEDPENPKTIHVFAVGKAAATMAWGLAECNVPLIGHGVLPHGVAGPTIPGMQWRHAAHPIPDEASFAAGKAWLELTNQIPVDAPVLMLLSGGASSLLEHPEHVVSPDGASIETINEARKKQSLLKDGKWIKVLHEHTNKVRAWILPDVPPGREEELVGSGLAKGASCRCLRGNKEFLQSLAGLLSAFGVKNQIHEPYLEGPTEETLPQFLQAATRGTVLIGGGETYTKPPAKVVGGRNHHAALFAAIHGRGTFLALGTDGIDGTTGAAGAWTEPDRSPEAKAALERFDAFSYLKTSMQTGPTGTNVGDVWLYLPK